MTSCLQTQAGRPKIALFGFGLRLLPLLASCAILYNPPMALNADQLAQCIRTLDASLNRLLAAPKDSIDYEVFRNAVVKGFELTLETAGKLLRKTLRLYEGSSRAIDELTFKDVLRHAAKHGLLETDAVERWFDYRNNRNNTAHDYGQAFAEETLKLIPRFLEDAKHLHVILQQKIET